MTELQKLKKELLGAVQTKDEVQKVRRVALMG